MSYCFTEIKIKEEICEMKSKTQMTKKIICCNKIDYFSRVLQLSLPLPYKKIDRSGLQSSDSKNNSLNTLICIGKQLLH